jgi:tetratricopeptide (TPR) repeat protein
MRIWVIVLALWLAPAAARAEWLEASSPHFVVYADDSERDVRKFSEQLERYHEAMEIVTDQELAEPSPSNRVTVFVVKNLREIQRLTGSPNIAGFYIPRAGGSVAFVPHVETSTLELPLSMNTLLHEYAHHFIISNSNFPLPRWLSEGSAEFFSSARFPAKGGFQTGLPARDNYLQLKYADLSYIDKVTVEELLDPDLYEKRRRDGYDSFYGKSWALYHYLSFEPERSGQLNKYLDLMTSGKTSREAALEAFGPFNLLDRDLASYMRRSNLLGIVFEPGVLQTGRIDVRPLSNGEVAMMPVRIRSDRGVTREQALELLIQARAVAARFPGDAAVLSALAEAEFDAGNDAEAIAAADAALALDPAQVNAYVQKGYALFRRASGVEGEERIAAYRTAVAPFLALNRIENDHPIPLMFFYRSFAERGTKPPEQAVLGLRRAAELAPFDLGLRLTLATQQMQAGELDEARANLVPVAYNPHGGDMAGGARQVIERIDAGGEPPAEELLALLVPTAPAADAADGGQ